MHENSPFYYVQKYTKSNEESNQYERNYFTCNSIPSLELLGKYYCIHLDQRVVIDSEQQIFQLGIDYAHPGYQLHNRCMNFLYLNFVIGGKGYINGIYFEKGYCFYTKPGQVHSMLADVDEPWTSVWLALDGRIAQQVCNLLDTISNEQTLQFYHIDELWKLTNFYIYNVGLDIYNTDFTGAITQQYLSFITSSPQSRAQNNTAFHRYLPLVNQTMLYAEKNLRSVTVKELADQVHLDHKYFTKVFTSLIGQSPQQYIINSKMKVVAHCLVYTDTPIENIVDMLGYSHRNSLDSAFRTVYGMSPAQYRKHHSKKEEHE